MEDLRPRGIVPGVEAAAVMADGLELQGMNCRGQAVSAAGEDGQLYPLSYRDTGWREDKRRAKESQTMAEGNPGGVTRTG